jgi:hypothetical protein
MAVAPHTKEQAWTRRLYDGCKSTDDVRVTTGPGRYQLDAPVTYSSAVFVPEPTIRQQKWGAAQNKRYVKTDVESDLFNMNRPPTKNACHSFDPAENAIAQAPMEPAQEAAFPQTHSRLVDPPCTLRSSGTNRWEWLCANPQDGVMMPFDNLVTTRLQQKDQYRPCIPRPLRAEGVLPAPLSSSPLLEAVAAAASFDAAATRQAFARDAAALPEGANELFGIQGAPAGF